MDGSVFVNYWWVPVAVVALMCMAFMSGKWYANLNSDHASFRELMEEVRRDLKTILSRLPTAAVASGNLLRLTYFGEVVSARIQAKKIASNIADDLRDRAKDMTEHEIQKLCFDHVKKQWQPSDEMLDAIKAFAYENGTETDDVLEVIALELQDCLLSSGN